MLLHDPPLSRHRRRPSHPPRHTLRAPLPTRHEHPRLRLRIRPLPRRRVRELCIATEKLQDLLHAQLARAAVFAALDGLVGELALLLLQLEDALFDRVGDGDLVDYDVCLLREAVNAVDSLLFDELWGVSVCLMLSDVGKRSRQKGGWENGCEGNLRGSKMAQG
jgi:hypothetical protein